MSWLLTAIANAAARPTRSAVRVHVGVGHRVPVLAGVRSVRDSGGTHSPQHVLPARDGLKVVGVDAVPNATQVIEVKAGRDGSDLLLVDEPVREHLSTFDSDQRVAVDGEALLADPALRVQRSRDVTSVLQHTIQWGNPPSRRNPKLPLGCQRVAHPLPASVVFPAPRTARNRPAAPVDTALHHGLMVTQTSSAVAYGNI